MLKGIKWDLKRSAHTRKPRRQPCENYGLAQDAPVERGGGVEGANRRFATGTPNPTLSDTFLESQGETMENITFCELMESDYNLLQKWLNMNFVKVWCFKTKK